MRPSQVLDMQGDLLERLQYDDRWRKMNAATITAEIRSGQNPKTRDRDPRAIAERDQAAELVMDLCRRHVAASYAYRVTEDMMDLLLHAANSLEPEDLWDPQQAPTGCGLVRFEKPIALAWVPGHEGATLEADWMIWGPGEAGRTMLWFFADPQRDRERFAAWVNREAKAPEDVIAALGRWVLCGWDSFRPGMSMGPSRLPLPGRAITEAEVAALANTPYENARAGVPALATLPDEMNDLPASALQQSNDARIATALWLLLSQTITVLHDEPIDRSSRKRAIRKGLPPRVTTIALRRPENRPSGGDTHVEWQHSWIVRGHWRWQPCGPNRSERRRIWIGPYVKGPEDKPLKQSEKVYDLRR